MFLKYWVDMIPTLRYIKDYVLKPEGQNPPKILSYGLNYVKTSGPNDVYIYIYMSYVCVFVCVCVCYIHGFYSSTWLFLGLQSLWSYDHNCARPFRPLGHKRCHKLSHGRCMAASNLAARRGRRQGMWEGSAWSVVHWSIGPLVQDRRIPNLNQHVVTSCTRINFILWNKDYWWHLMHFNAY